ncbi:cytoplasmic tRNA 2-thiolation protein 2 [Cotesia glomerata]|uniref:Cytoplasmic tRNA 2-thiolation protein 2 n=1 Tax=Cotesia glomerata TaxID=32391 RepID=A0AAV7HTM7_COTGL|nr:cytoplasmic tRNA 2-thiolation protein 2 [Cotesia glomerata]KAH0534459.1 hypothetical protein KQX54_004057 [Cotesia glomerata]
MCSLDGDCVVDVVERVEKKIFDGNENCRKCNSKSRIKLRGSDNYCNDCFEAYATHKFRGTLGKSKLVRPNDKILVGFSGSAGSVALLNLIRAGMQESVHKRLVFETQVIFIDDFLEPRTEIDKKTSIDSIITLIKSFGFPGYVTSLSEIYNPELKIKSIHNIDEINYNYCQQASEESLKNLFQALTNKTAKQELLKKLRLTLLASVARNLQCSKVFLADSATSLAVDILSNVAVGRGAQLSLDVGFVDDRFQELAILRPMRDFTEQELDYYLELHGLETLQRNKKTNDNPFESIQKLTEDFVLDLESQFTGTVSTVYRTGAKISSQGFSAEEQQVCVICNAPVDTKPQDGATAILATEFSRFISTRGVKAVERNNGDCGSFKEPCGGCQGDCGSKKEQRVTVEQLRRFLCYGCRLIVDDKFEIDKLPGNISNKVKQLACFEDMREQIKDFLL